MLRKPSSNFPYNPNLFRLALHYSNPSFQTPSVPQLKNPTSTSVKNGSYLRFSNSRITHLGRDGNLEGAQHLFDAMPFRDVVSWTALLTAYTGNGKISKAREVFDQMPMRNSASWNAMISGYISGSKISEAHDLFSQMPSRDLVTYSTMISGFAKSGMMKEAEQVYREMPDKWQEPVASNALICGYFSLGDFKEAERIFSRMVVRDFICWSSMVDGYCKCERISDALKVFKVMPERNVVLWTSIIRGLLKVRNWEDGFSFFSKMRREGVIVNSTTLSVVLDACAELDRSREGFQIHGLVLVMGFEHNVVLCNCIIAMYSRAGCVESARMVFDTVKRKDVVSWNSIINAYVGQNKIEDARSLFEAMPEKDTFSWTSMVVGFSNRGWTKELVHLIEAMPHKDNVAWTAIISGLVSNGQHERAFRLFHQIVREGIKPDPLFVCSVLSATAGLAILDQGAQVHAIVIKFILESIVSIQNSLVSMYAKCGSLKDAYRIFLGIGKPNLVSVNSMITAFAQHGFATEALQLFQKMEAGGFKPNQITFLGILSACSRSGLVREGYHYFTSMRSVYGIEPGPDHYTCMVDLLGRAGLLRQAVALINSMPDEVHSAVWGALLSSSGIHDYHSLAKLASQRLLELEPGNAAAYAVLSNMYSMAGMKENEKEVRMEKWLKGVKKRPGCSWIVLDKSICNAA